MTVNEVQAVKKELLDLDMELKELKGEILADRVIQLERRIGKPAVRPRPRTRAISALSACYANA